MKSYSIGFLLVMMGFSACAQQRPVTSPQTLPVTPTPVNPFLSTGVKPKPYKDIITDKAITSKGLFTVHKVDDKWYFELADSVMGEEILAVTRYSKTPAAAGSFGGERVNEQTIRWERGPSNNIFLRVVTFVSLATDSTQPIFQAVRNSNVDPIAASFDIKAFGKDSNSVVIDVTDFFRGDNQVVSLSPAIKRRFNLSGIAFDRSFIQTIHSYPINTEIKTVKTYYSSPAGGGLSLLGMFSPSVTLPAAEAAGAVTLELNTSFLQLPKIPLRKRLFDSRVGYFASNVEVFSDDQQRVDHSTFIHRWRLEPKDEDLEKWERGKLVEPKKPILFYIDPATPRQWRQYIIAGVSDWRKAFEKAGFENAIVAKEWPEKDSTMSLEDARFSVIRYMASDIENAYGPNEADPRSGEILESHIYWYHNLMKQIHNWYMIQAALCDPRARKMKFDDALMGELIRSFVSHEVGHALGLRHNMGSSSRTPVEKLRDKKWVEANGHTVSIMDYARFNYVAQPEDGIGPAGLNPRIGPYDEWAIRWGYRPITGTKNEEEDRKILNKWVVDSLAANPRLWFGGEAQNFDPRSQTEDLGDNAMKAGEYGIRNLKKILIQLPKWTKEEADEYDNLEEMYEQLIGQYNRYMYHVVKNIGGIYETFKTVEQNGDVYAPVSKGQQKEALQFLDRQLFQTPAWLIDTAILNKFSNPGIAETAGTTQVSVLNSLLGTSRLFRMSATSYRFGPSATYPVDDYLDDLRKIIWTELASHKPMDIYRRNLQRNFTNDLIELLNPPSIMLPPGFPKELAVLFGGNLNNSDVPSLARANLVILKQQITAALPATKNKLDRYHYEDLLQKIKEALNPAPGK